ncbi:serine/threonine protein kinase [Spiractinospora alimapuensis]|nr:serine/threonine protein kinase [Spiractinospora alimapuensis]
MTDAELADTVETDEGEGGDKRTLAGRYQLMEELGHGGMGVVWRARDLLLRRDVAVKELRMPDDISSTERDELVERTSHEARLAARLRHHNVVRVHEVVNEDRRPWIVMELVTAQTLGEVIAKAGGPLPYQRVAEIGLQLISALSAAHDEGIVHRDVKPDNVLIADNGRVVLTDFGLAVWAGAQSLTASGRVVGSPAYIPPERAQAGTVGPASDLWSLGATLYTAVDGYPPYDRKGYISILRGEELSDPKPARTAGPLSPVLEGLLHVRPEDRLTAENATKMLRIAALAPPTQDGEEEPEAEPEEPPWRGEAEGSAEEAAEDDGDRAGDERSETDGPSARGQLTLAIQESLHDSVSSLSGTVSSAFYRGSHARRHESVSELLVSIRESTDNLGLTKTGRHRDPESSGRSRHVAIAVAITIVALLCIILWGLVAR